MHLIKKTSLQKCLTWIVCSSLTIIGVAQPASNPLDENKWELVFEDNFDGNSLDLKKWELIPHARANCEANSGSQEYNSLDNIELKDGIMSIVAKKEKFFKRAIHWKDSSLILGDGKPNYREFNYTSSNLWTKEEFGYGRFEIRCQLPNGKGFFPAFWTYGDPPWSEIDIFEFWNERNWLGLYRKKWNAHIPHFNAHHEFDHGSKYTAACPSNFKGDDYSSGFHTFTMVWDEFQIQWYVDGELKRTQYKYASKSSDGKNSIPIDRHNYQEGKDYEEQPCYPPVREQHIIVNLAIQKDRNRPNRRTPFPSAMQVDYIRYYLPAKIELR